MTVAEGARVSVAVRDAATGETVRFGDGTFVTASIVKVDILAALLLGAQDARRELTAGERSCAAAMIERSDNDSASALWEAIGRARGLDEANARFGLTGTAGGTGGLWGLTRTTAMDQVRLLGRVFGADGPLIETSRDHVRELMERVVPDQAWGVPVVADGASAWAVKNGWLPRDATGLWVVNTIGHITADGRPFLLAALSDGNPTKEQGIARVETAARAAVRALLAHGRTG